MQPPKFFNKLFSNSICIEEKKYFQTTKIKNNEKTFDTSPNVYWNCFLWSGEDWG